MHGLYLLLSSSVLLFSPVLSDFLGGAFYPCFIFATKSHTTVTRCLKQIMYQLCYLNSGELAGLLRLVVSMEWE